MIKEEYLIVAIICYIIYFAWMKKEWLIFNLIMCIGYLTGWFKSDDDMNS